MNFKNFQRCLSLIIVLFVGSISSAESELMCSKAHRKAYLQVAEGVFIQRAELFFGKGRSERPYEIRQGGLIEVSPNKFVPEVSEGVTEVLRHYVRSGATKIKFDKKTRQIESIVLGIPIGHGYTVEVLYKAMAGQRTFGSLLDGEAQQEVAFRGLYFHLAEVVEPPPSTLRIGIPLTIKRKDGVVDNDHTRLLGAIGPLTGIPHIGDFNYKIDVPEAIEGPVLEKLEEVAERLQYMPNKTDLLPYLQDGTPESIAELQKHLFVEQQKAMSGDYMHRGVHKQLPKIIYGFITSTIGKVMTAGAIVGAIAFFPEQSYDAAKWVYSKVTVSSSDIARSMVSEWSQKANLPDSVRGDLKKLEAMLENQARQGRFNQNLQNYPSDINKGGKFNFESTKYLWFETRIDKEKNQAVEILYIAKLGADNQWVMYAMPINPHEIPNLFQYTKNKLKVSTASE